MKKEVKRGNYIFRYFLDVDCEDYCHADVEGSSVYEIDDNGCKHYLMGIDFTTPDQIEEMTDEEFDNFLNEYGIF